VRARQARFEGSFRQRRGLVLAALRAEARVALGELDGEAVDALVADGLAAVEAGWVSLPGRPARPSSAGSS
jgi:hypothetical protein